MPVVHAVPLALEDPKSLPPKLRLDRLGVEPSDAVSSLLALERETRADGDSGDQRPSRLADAHGRTRDARHLRETGERVVEVMEAVVNEDDVDGGVTKGKPGGVSDDSEELEAVTTLPLDRATQGTERDVERDDLALQPAARNSASIPEPAQTTRAVAPRRSIPLTARRNFSSQ